MSDQTPDKRKLLETAFEAVRRLRFEGALVHSITNTVAQNFTANVLLACGATPSMTVAPDEVEHFSKRADAVLINLGTLDDQRIAAIHKTVGICKATDKPFVLDPVMCHVSPPRLKLAKEIASADPAIIRVNRQEAEALGSDQNSPNGVMVVTGKQDRMVVEAHGIALENGHPWLSKVTAIGCAQGALMAALLTKTEPATAALAALVWFAIAGEEAARMSGGPGTFQANFLDQLHSVSLPRLRERATLS